tara:strand:- start:18376 stop:19251 length:876 start_codon:yes stop_codon:yes gene_type:complete
MHVMTGSISIIGFGEAAQAFTGDSNWSADVAGFDIKLLDPEDGRAVLASLEQLGVRAHLTNADATRRSSTIISLVTADQVLAAAAETAEALPEGALYLDMNSVAPDRKRECAKVIGSVGGRYVDVAIMAPVHPARLGVPLLLSGPYATEAEELLRVIGFKNVRVVGSQIGDASTVKMVRSVMIKGIEALTAECFIAADAAGVTQEVLDSLGSDWPRRVNYNFDRMLVHGKRRAAEMEEVCATLEGLGVEPLLTRGTVARQFALGSTLTGPVPETLDAKLALARKDQKVPSL